jgi:hypothetical protein
MGTLEGSEFELFIPVMADYELHCPVTEIANAIK